MSLKIKHSKIYYYHELCGFNINISACTIQNIFKIINLYFFNKVLFI